MAEIKLETIPVGTLGIIAMDNIMPLAEKVDAYLAYWRSERERAKGENALHFRGYQRDSYILGSRVPRFGSGEGKGEITESVRGYDVYIMTDVLNNSLTCISLNNSDCFAFHISCSLDIRTFLNNHNLCCCVVRC